MGFAGATCGTLVPCPPRARGAPGCVCDEEYVGDLRWPLGGSEWEGRCEAITSEITVRFNMTLLLTTNFSDPVEQQVVAREIRFSMCQAIPGFFACDRIREYTFSPDSQDQADSVSVTVKIFPSNITDQVSQVSVYKALTGIDSLALETGIVDSDSWKISESSFIVRRAVYL